MLPSFESLQIVYMLVKNRIPSLGWAGYEEIGEEVLSSWERQEPDLVTA